MKIHAIAATLVCAAVLACPCRAQAQALQVQKYGTTGHPTEALLVSDAAHAGQQFVLVTVTGNGGGGIDVFRVDTQGEAETLKRVAYQPLGGGGNAQGIVLIPHTRILAVGLTNAGIAFLPLDDALAGKAKAQVLPQGSGPGTGYLAATPDGQFLFAANEYGDHGNIGVIALHPGGVAAMTPTVVAYIPAPNATPGVSISPDGTRVYTVGEVVRPETAARLAGHGVAELQRDSCTQARADHPTANGALYVIDVAKAEALPVGASPQQVRQAVIAVENAGCSPVRQVSSADGAFVYVTARGDNRVLVFDTHALVADREHAFVRAIPTGGEAPVGLGLFAGDTKLLVANSNRFAGGPGNVTVFDLTEPAKPKLLQTIKTGEFPRNVSVAPDGKTVFVTVFKADEILVLR